jgi:hypothetical protein
VYTIGADPDPQDLIRDRTGIQNRGGLISTGSSVGGGSISGRTGCARKRDPGDSSAGATTSSNSLRTTNSASKMTIIFVGR